MNALDQLRSRRTAGYSSVEEAVDDLDLLLGIVEDGFAAARTSVTVNPHDSLADVVGRLAWLAYPEGAAQQWMRRWQEDRRSVRELEATVERLEGRLAWDRIEEDELT